VFRIVVHDAGDLEVASSDLDERGVLIEVTGRLVRGAVDLGRLQRHAPDVEGQDDVRLGDDVGAGQVMGCVFGKLYRCGR